MVGDGIVQNVNVPASAMERALAPVAPGGRALEPLRRTAQRAGTNVAPAAATAPTAAMGDVSAVQQFFGPTTSGGRLQEINWRTDEPRVGKECVRDVKFGGVPST